MKENKINNSIIIKGYTPSSNNHIPCKDITKGINILSYDMEKIYTYCYTDFQGDNEKINNSKMSIVIDTEVKDFKKKEVKKMNRNRKKFSLPNNFNGKLDYSLFIKKFYELYPNEFAADSFGKQYTDAIINVTCKRPYKVVKLTKKGVVSCKVQIKANNKFKVIKNKKTIMDKLQLRKYLYTNGFKFNDTEYCFFTRSSSKARNGASLFIKKEYLQTMLDWLRISIKFVKGEECAISNLKAYESLVFSSIEPVIIKMEPHQILIVSDIMKKIPSVDMLASRLVKKEVNGKLIECVETKLEKISEINNITDGESMLDESVFVDIGKEDKGCILTRARWFKSCAFNTRLVAFLKNHYGDEYETAFIKDDFGRDVKVSDIRWVITPSSLKLFKFSYKIADRDTIISRNEPKRDNETFKQYKKRIDKMVNRACYDYWLKHLRYTNYEFGVCKSEKSSQFGDWQQLSYQMLMALRLSMEELLQLIKPHLSYINNLKKDDTIFNWYLHNNCIGIGKDLVDNLLAINSKAYELQLYREKKSNITSALVDRLRNGQVLVKDCDYSIAFGNCIEFLYHVVGIKKKVMTGYECYSPRYQDGEELFCTRNPVVCSSNIGLMKNIYHDDYKWFNLSSNIFVLNANDCNTLTKYSGEDYDSDCNILGNNKVLVDAARRVQNDILHYNGIEQTTEDKKKKKYYTDECMSETDHIISENLIGQVINTSQILNAIYQDINSYLEKARLVFDKIASIENKDLRNRKFADLRKSYNIKKLQLLEIAKDTAKCNNMSNVEIDKAKKQLSVNSAYELSRIYKKDYINRAIDTSSKKTLSKRRFEYFDLLTQNKSIESVIEYLLEEQAKKPLKHKEKFIEELYKHIDNGFTIQEVIQDFLEFEVNKIIRPGFFKYTTKKSDAYVYKPMNCTMDWLEEIIDSEIVDGSRVRRYLSIYELFNVTDEDYTKAERKRIGKVRYICTEANKYINSIPYISKEAKEDYLTRQEYIKATGDLLKSNVDLTELDLKALIIKAFIDKPRKNKTKDKYWKMYDEELHGMRLVLMDMLYAGYPELMMSCFKSLQDDKVETLEECGDGDIEMLGIRYKKVRNIITDVA